MCISRGSFPKRNLANLYKLGSGPFGTKEIIETRVKKLYRKSQTYPKIFRKTQNIIGKTPLFLLFGNKKDPWDHGPSFSDVIR